jgi:hypothetical protein
VRASKYCESQQILWEPANIVRASKYCESQQILWEPANIIVRASKYCESQQILWEPANSVRASKYCESQQIVWEPANIVRASKYCESQQLILWEPANIQESWITADEHFELLDWSFYSVRLEFSTFKSLSFSLTIIIDKTSGQGLMPGLFKFDNM